MELILCKELFETSEFALLTITLNFYTLSFYETELYKSTLNNGNFLKKFRLYKAGPNLINVTSF